MGLDNDFLSMLTHEVTLYRYMGQDTVGNNTYASGVSIPAFITETNRNFAPVDTQNRQRVAPASGSRLITDAEAIKVGDKIVLPDGEVTYVTGAQTFKDEAEDLMQNVDVETEQES
jgi:hypothetical protein